MIERYTSIIAVAALTLTGSACFAQRPDRPMLAFPGAEGAAATSLGGRGGHVLRVSNLNDSGPGSLRAAVEAKGPRTVVFDVGGTIRLRSPLGVRNGRITIAGQTAPGGGITVRDYPLNISADDVVVRFIRSRMGDQARAVADAMWVTRGTRIIVDHVSASWGTDEVLSVSSGGRDNGDVTVQWSIISESLCNSVNPDGRHCYGSLISGSKGARITFHHNLWAHHAARMPRIGNGLSPDKDPQGGFFDIRSNVMYNWGGREAGYGGLPLARATYSFVDNSYVTGPNSRGQLMFSEGNSAAKAHFAGNMVNGSAQRSPAERVKGGERANYLQREPLRLGPSQPDPAASAFGRVLAHSGASLVRDDVDKRVVSEVGNRTGRLIDSQSDVGGWPLLERGKPWVDSDGDGLPDSWERSHRLNPRDPRDAAQTGPSGYTRLEDWLNALAAPAMGH